MLCAFAFPSIGGGESIYVGFIREKNLIPYTTLCAAVLLLVVN